MNDRKPYSSRGFVGSPGMNFLSGSIGRGTVPVARIETDAIPLDGYPLCTSIGDSREIIFRIRPEHVSLANHETRGAGPGWLPEVAQESPCFEHQERTCTPAGRGAALAQNTASGSGTARTPRVRHRPRSIPQGSTQTHLRALGPYRRSLGLGTRQFCAAARLCAMRLH